MNPFMMGMNPFMMGMANMPWRQMGLGPPSFLPPGAFMRGGGPPMMGMRGGMPMLPPGVRPGDLPPHALEAIRNGVPYDRAVPNHIIDPGNMPMWSGPGGY